MVDCRHGTALFHVAPFIWLLASILKIIIGATLLEAGIGVALASSGRGDIAAGAAK